MIFHKKTFLPDNCNANNMNDNPKDNILMSENIRQKCLIVLEYFDLYICHQIYALKYSRIVSFFCLIFSDIKMLFFGLSFILSDSFLFFSKEFLMRSILICDKTTDAIGLQTYVGQKFRLTYYFKIMVFFLSATL